jgi:hypothetical protein
MAKRRLWSGIAVAAAAVAVSATAVSWTSRASAEPNEVLVYTTPT